MQAVPLEILTKTFQSLEKWNAVYWIIKISGNTKSSVKSRYNNLVIRVCEAIFLHIFPVESFEYGSYIRDSMFFKETRMFFSHKSHLSEYMNKYFFILYLKTTYLSENYNMFAMYTEIISG